MYQLVNMLMYIYCCNGYVFSFVIVVELCNVATLNWFALKNGSSRCVIFTSINKRVKKICMHTYMYIRRFCLVSSVTDEDTLCTYTCMYFSVRSFSLNLPFAISWRRASFNPSSDKIYPIRCLEVVQKSVNSIFEHQCKVYIAPFIETN